MEITPPPDDDWPDYCSENKAWCLRVINHVLKIRELQNEIFGDIPTPRVPEAKKEEVRLKCHQVPACVKRAEEKLKTALMKVSESN